MKVLAASLRVGFCEKWLLDRTLLLLSSLLPWLLDKMLMLLSSLLSWLLDKTSSSLFPRVLNHA